MRQLTHALHGHVAATSGKRIAKFMPKVAGAWLAGLYDTDRSVSRAAQDAFTLVFPTPEKQAGFGKVFQRPILEYHRDAIMKETVQTLSDERAVSPEDAQAKYARLVSSSISVISSLLQDLPKEEIDKQQDLHDEILSTPKLWDFCYHPDALVRKAMYRLLRICSQTYSSVIAKNQERISADMISKACAIDQTGSAYDFSETLLALTKASPQVWSESYRDKKKAIVRLQQLLKQGSRGAAKVFWSNICQVIEAIPNHVLPRDLAGCTDFCLAFRAGVTSKDELRSNANVAWSAYFRASATVMENLSEEDKEKIAQEMLLPVLENNLALEAPNPEWLLPANQALSIISEALSIQKGPVQTYLLRAWPALSEKFIEKINTLLPEQSNDFEKSQDNVARQGESWFALQAKVPREGLSTESSYSVERASQNIILAATKVLKSRNGKPYGAAAVVEAAIRHCSDLIFTSAAGDDITAFINNDLTRFLHTPSASRLIDILYMAKPHLPNFEKVFRTVVGAGMGGADSPAKQSVAESLFFSRHLPPDFRLIKTSEALQEYIRDLVSHSLEEGTWHLPNRVFRRASILMSDALVEETLANLANSLSDPHKQLHVLHPLEEFASQNPDLMRRFISSALGAQLLPSLLSLTEGGNEETAQHAARINTLIQRIVSHSADGKASGQPMVDLIQNGLNEASDMSLSVPLLVEQAQKLSLEDGVGQPSNKVPVLPDLRRWAEALTTFLEVPPPKSIGITNILGGAVYLIQSNAPSAKLPKIPRDPDGFTVPLRMAYYTTRILKNEHTLTQVGDTQLTDIYRLLSLTVQLADDNMTCADANGLWSIYTHEVENEILDFISEANGLLRKWLSKSSSWWHRDTLSSYSFVSTVIDTWLEETKGASSSAYHNARAYASAVSELIEMHGWHQTRDEELGAKVQNLWKSQEAFHAIAILTAHKVPLGSKRLCQRVCNELVADLTGLDIAVNPRNGLSRLIYLNDILHNQLDMTGSIAKQRLVFLMKHLVSWLQDDNADDLAKAEICKLLQVVLPTIRDLYGSHWSQILEMLVRLWSSRPSTPDVDMEDSRIPLVHSSLKLYSTLKSLTEQDDVNDDLIDAWKEFNRSASAGLIMLLENFQHRPDEYNQPLRVVNELLARQISKISTMNLDSPEELYPLLSVDSQSIQKTAFGLLHRHILAAQEQISFQVALEKKDARLPEELLSLILGPPNVDTTLSSGSDRTVPSPLMGYLFSWKLVFDHFPNAVGLPTSRFCWEQANAILQSYKVKMDYIEEISKGDYLQSLLDFMFSFLGHERGKPVDVSKFDVTTWEPDVEESPTRTAQWFMSHLYYLCLMYMPSLAKAWWTDCKSRQKKFAVEHWSEKYVRPNHSRPPA